MCLSTSSMGVFLRGSAMSPLPAQILPALSTNEPPVLPLARAHRVGYFDTHGFLIDQRAVVVLTLKPHDPGLPCGVSLAKSEAARLRLRLASPLLS